MASLIFDSAVDDEARGAIDYDSDSFKGLLVTSSYTPNKGTHTKRSDVTNEVTGTGYTAGGVSVAVTVTKDTTNHRVTLQFGAINFATSGSGSARGLVIYKTRGGAASADELVLFNDFGVDVSLSAGVAVAASTITKQN